MTEPAPQPASDQVDDLKADGFTVAEAFDIAGLRWLGPAPATWADLEHEIHETAEVELKGP